MPTAAGALLTEKVQKAPVPKTCDSPLITSTAWPNEKAVPRQSPPVASSSAPPPLAPSQGVPPVAVLSTTTAADGVTLVCGTSVRVDPSTRTETVAALAGNASTRARNAPAVPALSAVVMEEPPLSTRAVGWCGRRRSPGSRADSPRLPRPQATQWLRRGGGACDRASPVTVAGP